MKKIIFDGNSISNISELDSFLSEVVLNLHLILLGTKVPASSPLYGFVSIARSALQNAQIHTSDIIDYDKE